MLSYSSVGDGKTCVPAKFQHFCSDCPVSNSISFPLSRQKQAVWDDYSNSKTFVPSTVKRFSFLLFAMARLVSATERFFFAKGSRVYATERRIFQAEPSTFVVSNMRQWDMVSIKCCDACMCAGTCWLHGSVRGPASCWKSCLSCTNNKHVYKEKLYPFGTTIKVSRHKYQTRRSRFHTDTQRDVQLYSRETLRMACIGRV